MTIKKIQDKILKGIDELIKNYDCELVISKSAINAGTAYIMEEMHTLCYITYTFEYEYCDISMYNVDDALMMSWNIKYKDGDKINKMLKDIESHIELATI